MAATWSRLQTFREVAARGSIKAAAAALHVTEPAVSAAVAALEKELGTALLAREGRGIVLTPAGETYAGYCRSILALVDEAAEEARGADHPTLRLGVVSAASEYVLPEVLRSHRRAHPSAQVTVRVAPRDDLFDALEHRECDVVLAGRPPSGRGLVVRARRPNELVVIGAPPAAGGPVAPREAAWLLRSPGSGIRRTTLALLDQLELQPETLELGGHGACVAAARAGLGVTLAHADAVAADIEAGRLVTHRLPGTPLPRPWLVTTSSTLRPAVKDFLAVLTDADRLGGNAFHTGRHPRG